MTKRLLAFLLVTAFAGLGCQGLLWLEQGCGAPPRRDGGSTDEGQGGSADGGFSGDAGSLKDGGDLVVPGRLTAPSFPPLLHSPGSPLAAGLATGRIYEQLAGNVDRTMQDFAALGV